MLPGRGDHAAGVAPVGTAGRVDEQAEEALRLGPALHRVLLVDVTGHVREIPDPLIRLIAAADPLRGAKLAKAQFDAADNMTDRQGALAILVSLDAPERDAPDPRRWKALAVCLVAGFMTLLDVSIVNTAIPAIQKDIGASFASGINLNPIATGAALAIQMREQDGCVVSFFGEGGAALEHGDHRE